MPTHIRTTCRLIPTAAIHGFGQIKDHPDEVFISDPWSGKLARGFDVVKFETKEAAQLACMRIRDVLQAGRSNGPYVRLCPPGVPDGNRRWRVVAEQGRRRRVLGFDDSLSAQAAFEQMCREVDAVDVMPTIVTAN